MKKECEFTSGELYSVYDAFGLVAPTSFALMANHLDLQAVFQFTEAEQVEIDWEAQITPIGVPDRVTFSADCTMTRRLTSSQRKYAADVIQRAALGKAPAYFTLYLKPVLEKLGYPIAAPKWEDEEEEDDG